MMPYSSLSMVSKGFTAGGYLLAMSFSVMILVMVIALRMQKRYVVFSAALTAVLLTVMQGLNDVSLYIVREQPFNRFAGFFAGLPYAAVVSVLISAAVIEILFLIFLQRKQRSMLTPNAVKESLDALPDGICFFEGDGQPLLVNTRMHRFSSDLFGGEILNCELFWEKLNRGDFSGGAELLSTSPAVTIRTAEGGVWDFRRKELLVGGCLIHEMTAFNVTRQYTLSEELTRRNEILNQVNRRLREYSRKIEKVTAERELLAAKVHVHDDVGRALLAFRSSYLNLPPEKRDRKRLLRLWRATVSVMRKEAVSGEEISDWKLLQQAAEAVDVKMILEGQLPEEGTERSILIAAVHECLTNTVKHAGGHRLNIAVTVENGMIRAEFTNDGTPPAEAIKETGGLHDLRVTVENAGGIMEIKSVPRFALHIEIGKGAKTDG
ncbi:MAG: sensor histidine kinase [Emergencia sp.]